MDWLKGKLFGRQLSHGSENEAPATFDEALNPQPPQADVVQQVQMPPMSEVVTYCTIIERRACDILSL